MVYRYPIDGAATTVWGQEVLDPILSNSEKDADSPGSPLKTCSMSKLVRSDRRWGFTAQGFPALRTAFSAVTASFSKTKMRSLSSSAFVI